MSKTQGIDDTTTGTPVLDEAGNPVLDDEGNPVVEPVSKPKPLSAQVSEKFWLAVRDASRQQQYTISTLLRWSVEKAIGKNPEVPKLDAVYESYILSTQLDEATNNALEAWRKSHTDSEGKPDPITRADVLRRVAADATGYDLSQEPERVGPGEGIKKRLEVAKNADSVLTKLYATQPDLVLRMLEAQSLTLADIGIVSEVAPSA